MTKILAIDAATVTGWAIGTTEPEAFGTIDFGATNDRAIRWWSFQEWLADMITEHEPTILAIEKPIFRGSGSLTLSGFTVVAELVAYLRDLTIVSINPSAVKKRAGVVGGLKPVAAAIGRGWDVRSPDEADACWILDLVASGLEKAA